MKKKKKWSAEVTENSHALALEQGVFTRSPKEIARSLKRSAEESRARKAPPFRSAMSMLNFYINRAGKNLSEEDLERLDAAKNELRILFDRRPSVKQIKAGDLTARRAGRRGRQ